MAKTYSMRFGSGDPRAYTGLSPTFLIFVNAGAGSGVTPPSITESFAGSGIYQFTWGTTTPIVFLADAATTTPGTSGRYVTGQLDPADRADEYGNTLVAFGTSIVAQGVSITALGTTAVALGTTSVALGTTAIAFGVSNIALGTTIYALEQQLGSTLVGIGNTSIALGNTILAVSGAGATFSGAIGSTASLIGDSVTNPVDLFGYLKRIAELLQGQQQFIKVAGTFSMYDRTGATLLNQRTVGNNATLVTRT